MLCSLQGDVCWAIFVADIEQREEVGPKRIGGEGDVEQLERIDPRLFAAVHDASRHRTHPIDAAMKTKKVKGDLQVLSTSIVHDVAQKTQPHIVAGAEVGEGVGIGGEGDESSPNRFVTAATINHDLRVLIDDAHQASGDSSL
jgi:hypothetical protein